MKYSFAFLFAFCSSAIAAALPIHPLAGEAVQMAISFQKDTGATTKPQRGRAQRSEVTCESLFVIHTKEIPPDIVDAPVFKSNALSPSQSCQAYAPLAPRQTTWMAFCAGEYADSLAPSL